MATYKKLRNTDAVLNFLLNLIASVAFGFWMNSWFAGVFMYPVINALSNIGFVTEYGFHLPQNDRTIV